MSDTAIEVTLAPPSRVSTRGVTRAVRIVAPLLVAAALLGLWELYVRVSNVSALLVPKPSDVFTAMVEQHHLIYPQMWTTLREVLTGYGIAASSGLVLAVLIVAFRPFELCIYPILVATQVVPKIALAPLILILFGLGNTSRIIIIVSLAFFPVVISTVVGLNSVEPAKIHLARSLGAGKFRTFVTMRLPQAMPDAFGGLKLAATRAVGAAVISEFITPGNSGLGRVILITATELRPEIAMACIFVLMAIGIGFFFAVTQIERLVMPWHASIRSR
jgi:NitT/TauT family transport system permease protein